MSLIRLSEGTIPTSPAAGYRVVFASSDGIYGLDSAGGTTLFGAGGGGGGGGIAAAAGTQTATTGTVVFSNSNNFTFGMSGSTRITASFSESTHSHSTGPGAVAAGTQTGTSGTIVFANSNDFTFGMSGSSQITASFSQSTHPHSTAPGAIAAGTQTGTSGTIVFANSNNMTFGMSGSSQITGSFSQSAQTQASGAIAGSGFTSTTTAGTAVVGTHNSAGLSMAFPVALTTARASTDAIGLATAQSNVTWTANSAGLSLDARGYAGTASSFGGTNISGSMTHNSGGLTLSMSVAAPGGGGGIAAAAGTQTATSGTVVFANSNNFTFGMSGSSQVTASFSESTHSHATAAFSGSNGSFTANTVTFGALNGLTFYTSNGSIVASHNALTSQSNQAFSAGAASSAFQTLSFQDSNGISFSNNAGAIRLTHGLAGTGTSITGGAVITLNSAGLQFNGAALAGTGTTFQGNNASGSMTFNSAGLNLSVSVAAPGAAAEQNAFMLLGANTAGNTTATGSTIGLSGIGVTLSGTNGSQIIISGGGGGGGVTMPGIQPYDDFVQALGQIGQASLIIDPQPLPNFQFDRVALLLQNTNSSNSSGSHTLSFWVGLYTRNDSTLSLHYSMSGSTALTHSGTAGSYSLYSGKRLLPLTVAQTTITENRYWIAFVSRTTSGGANGTYSNYMVSNLNTNFTGIFGQASNATMQPKLGQGFYSATTSGMPNSIAFSQIQGTNSLGMRMPTIGFASGTV